MFDQPKWIEVLLAPAQTPVQARRDRALRMASLQGPDRLARHDLIADRDQAHHWLVRRPQTGCVPDAHHSAPGQ